MTASDAHFTFPSPVGELHFSMQLKRSLMIILGFRPLSGNYISQSVFMDLDRIARGRVSVPCRGTTFLNMVQITLSLMKHTEFPSPVGELHFSMAFDEKLPSGRWLFPSPVGELHLSIIINNITKKN